MAQVDPILRFDAIDKSFFGTPVLKRVSLSLGRGSVLGLIGENGAGKSTLMNILGGVLRQDAGRMLLDGSVYSPRDCRAAAAQGIAFVHQELNLFLNLSVAENLCIENLPALRLGSLPLPVVDRGRLRRRARELLAGVELSCSPDTLVERLAPGERQLVEIARALSAGARVVIFDEPTTSLTARESERLFAIIGRLRAAGAAIIYISHRLEDVLRLCDELAVLRDGEVVAAGRAAEFTVDRAVSLMVGRAIDQLYPRRQAGPSDAVLLAAAGVSRRGALADISFSLRRGEILGLAGLMGAGRTELARTLFGLDPLVHGSIRVRGKPHRPAPRRSIRAGIAFVTEDRREEGLMSDASVLFNAALAALPGFAAGRVGWIDRAAVARGVAAVAQSTRLALPGAAEQLVRTLSGGNQQKVVLAKWLLCCPTVFILDEPTRGIDVGAKQEVYRIINSLAEQGAGVLMISSEIEELTGLCDRILVMAGGRIRGAFERAEFDREAILRLALRAEARA